MDWDLAIKHNSEALKGIIAVLFAMLGLDGRCGFADSALPPQRRAAVCSGPPNPPCAASLSLRPGVLW